MNTVGQRIRVARRAAGYSQGEFARLIGCAQSTLSEIESGETHLPSAPVLAKMTEILGMTDRWVLYGEDGEIQTPTPEEQELLTNFRRLSDEARRAIAETVKALAPHGKK